MPPIPPVPPEARRFHTDDLDEARATVRQADGEHWRVAHGTGPLGFDLARLELGRAALAWGRSRLAQTVRGGLHIPCLHLPVDPSRYAVGRQAFEAAAGDFVFLPQGAEFTRQGAPGSIFAITLQPDALRDEVQARRQAAGAVTAGCPRKLNGHLAGRQALHAVLSELAITLASPADPRRLAHCDAQIVSAVASLVDTDDGREPVSVLTAHRLADLEDWIEAHLAEAITLGRLCAVAGIGERSLQAAFGAARGMSPMRFVAERRLAAAHRRLVEGRPGDDVTSIAIGVGLAHLGRFATQYREVYGEPPSRTLQRARALR